MLTISVDVESWIWTIPGLSVPKSFFLFLHQEKFDKVGQILSKDKKGPKNIRSEQRQNDQQK